jgi:hypothetical protein
VASGASREPRRFRQLWFQRSLRHGDRRRRLSWPEDSCRVHLTGTLLPGEDDLRGRLGYGALQG